MKPHNKQITHWNKKQRRVNRLKLVVILVSFLILIVQGYWLLSLLMLLMFYVLQEILYSDHIFYNPRQDYRYHFNADITDHIDLSEGQVLWKASYQNNTLLLQLKLKSTFSGYVFDPYIELTAGRNNQRQYFERRLAGTRYVNLSHINKDYDEKVSIRLSGCKLADQQASLYGFINESLRDKKILLIAPHADDAEIAAFGVYSQHNSFIATLTAGEIEAEYYADAATDKVAASRFKGRLRAWDSIAVPQWGGLNTDKVIQLGYFCLTLGQMYKSPAQLLVSYTANLKDTRFFRSFNSLSLQSDAHGHANWISLLEDLTELIDKFKPDMILTPHPLLDPHQDHYYATLACFEACNKLAEETDSNPIDHFLLYANHYNHTDLFPFGLSGSLLSLPPEFEHSMEAVRAFSYATDTTIQKDKQAALGMMHDLTVSISLKKKFRHWLQHLLLRREHYDYADDEYFRKAIRANELFYKVNRIQLEQLVLTNESIRKNNKAKSA